MCHMKGASSSVVGVDDIILTLIDLRGHPWLHQFLALILVLILIPFLDLKLDNLLVVKQAVKE